MRKVILHELVTFDGLALDPGDRVDFVPASAQGDSSCRPLFGNTVASMDMTLLNATSLDRGAVSLRYVTRPSLHG